MEHLQIMMAGITAIILFIFGLEHFSHEIERISGERFRRFLGNATRVPIVGLGIGALVTAFIQSSSATSVITISLVNAGVLSFKNSVGIIFGSNIGTTMTAQLVAFKLTAFAPVFVIAGFLMSSIHSRWSIFGKAVFYFGFVFFSLNLIASSLTPLQENETLIRLLTHPQNPFLAILFGCAFTAVVQSSSVTTGLAIVFIQQGLLSLENAVPLIMGANIGTTATALIAMFNMDIAAKKTALSHFLFNAGGVLLFIPVLLAFGDRLSGIDMDPAFALAGLHLLFNVTTALIFIAFIGPFTRLIDTILGEGKMDFERLRLPVFNADHSFPEIKAQLQTDIDDLFYFLQENYNLVTLAIETNFGGIVEAAGKRIEYLSFVKRDFLGYFSRIVAKVNEKSESRQLIGIVNQFDYLFQIHDSINDLFDVKRSMNENYVELQSDILLLVRAMSSETLGLFNDIHKSIVANEPIDIRLRAQELQAEFDEVNKELLRLMADPLRRDAGALTNFITYSQRLKDKLVNFCEVRAKARDHNTPAIPE